MKHADKIDDGPNGGRLSCTCNADPVDLAVMGHLDDCPYWQPQTLAGDGWLFGDDEGGN